MRSQLPVDLKKADGLNMNKPQRSKVKVRRLRQVIVTSCLLQSGPSPLCRLGSIEQLDY